MELDYQEIISQIAVLMGIAVPIRCIISIARILVESFIEFAFGSKKRSVL